LRRFPVVQAFRTKDNKGSFFPVERWRVQLIDATLACSLSAGVSYPKVFLGCAPQEIVQRIGMSVEYAEDGWGILRAMHNGVIKGNIFKRRVTLRGNACT